MTSNSTAKWTEPAAQAPVRLLGLIVMAGALGYVVAYRPETVLIVGAAILVFIGLMRGRTPIVVPTALFLLGCCVVFFADHGPWSFTTHPIFWATAAAVLGAARVLRRFGVTR